MVAFLALLVLLLCLLVYNWELAFTEDFTPVLLRIEHAAVREFPFLSRFDTCSTCCNLSTINLTTIFTRVKLGTRIYRRFHHHFAPFLPFFPFLFRIDACSTGCIFSTINFTTMFTRVQLRTRIYRRIHPCLAPYRACCCSGVSISFSI